MVDTSVQVMIDANTHLEPSDITGQCYIRILIDFCCPDARMLDERWISESVIGSTSRVDHSARELCIITCLNAP